MRAALAREVIEHLVGAGYDGILIDVLWRRGFGITDFSPEHTFMIPNGIESISTATSRGKGRRPI